MSWDVSTYQTMKTIAHGSDQKLLKKIKTALSNSFSFRSISDDLLEDVLKAAHSVFLDAGDRLIKQGERQSNTLYILIKGNIDIFKDDVKITSIGSTGQLVGELSVLTNEPRTADVIATEKTHLVAIDSSFVQESDNNIDPALKSSYLKLLSIILAQKLNVTTEKAKLYEHAILEVEHAEELTDQLKEELKQKLFQIKLYSQVVENNQDAIFICDEKGQLTECNQAFHKLLGYKAKRLLNLNINDIIEHLFSSSKRKITSVGQSGWHGERNIIKANGRTFPGLITISQVREKSKNQNTKCYAVNIRDISLQREYEDSLLEKNRELRTTYQVLEDTVYELEKSNQFKNRFFSNVTSQLKSPLVSINTLSDLLRKFSNDSQVVQYIDGIVNEQQKLEQMVDNILTMTEINKDLTDINLSVFHIQDLLDNSDDQLTVKYLNKSQHSLMADKQKLKKALKECVSYLAKTSKLKKIDFMIYHFFDKKKGAHHIILTHKSLQTKPLNLISEQNEGTVINIDANIQDAELHLPLVKRIIEIHNGQFNLIQKNGLPAIKIVLPSEPEQGLTQTPTVMIVDADNSARKQYSQIIQGLFETVTIFEFTEQIKAINAMNALNPDVIIIDPAFESSEWTYDAFLKMVLEHKPDASVVFVISQELKTPEHRAKILALDIKEYLEKPFAKSDLVFRLNQFFSTHQQITVMSKNINKALESAFTDGLTGLFNRRYYDKFIEEEFMKANIQGQVCSVILLDVDNFKNYNDTNGHQFGDEVLAQVGKLLKDNTRKDDMAARYGGEEFVIVLPNTSKSMAKIFAEKVRKNVEKTKFPKESTQPLGKVTVSLGVACFPEDGKTVHEVVEIADNGLYQAKENGRNQVVCAEAKSIKK